MNGVAPSEKIHVTYPKEVGGRVDDCELPFKILVIGDFSGRLDDRLLEDRAKTRIDKASFSPVMGAREVGIRVAVPNRLSEEGELHVSLRFESLADFEPAAIAEQIPELRQLLTTREERLAANNPAARAESVSTAAAISELDRRLSNQLNEVLHHPRFQRLERAWRGLRFLVDRVDFEQNIQIEFVSVTKDELKEDFEDTPTLLKSGLYWHAYGRGDSQCDASPVGMILGDYEFDHSPDDVDLLRHVATIAAMGHAPFITNTSIRFFGCQSWGEVVKLPDLEALFDGPEYSSWYRFRESENARYVGLVGPRFLLRLPYSRAPSAEAPGFEEDVTQHESRLWGGSALALATCVADSFAKYRWCANIIGPRCGGLVDNLARYSSAKGELATETKLTLRRDYELSEQGFIGLVDRGDGDKTVFFSANSAQKPCVFGHMAEAQQAALTSLLGTMLPYTFIIARFAHYLKVMHSEHLGVFRDRSTVERDANQWLAPYAELAPGRHCTRPPLHEARVTLAEARGEPGGFKFTLRITPNFNYAGARFTLSLAGELTDAAH